MFSIATTLFAEAYYLGSEGDKLRRMLPAPNRRGAYL